MTIVNYSVGNMSQAQQDQFPDTDYVYAVRLPRDGEPLELTVSVLARPDLKVEQVNLSPGSTVPQLADTKFIELTYPDATVRYCTGGAGHWFWTGLVATDA